MTKCRVAGSGQETGRCPVQLAVSPASLPSVAGGETVNTTCSAEDSEDSEDSCHLSLAARADTDHFLTVTNVASVQLPVSLAVSITLSGCRDQTFTEGAMMVNSINTALLCGEANRRPVKILFQPSAGQPQLEECGETHKMTRRAGQGGVSSWSLPGSVGDKQVVHLTGNTSTTLTINMEMRDIGGNLLIEIAILTLVFSIHKYMKCKDPKSKLMQNCQDLNVRVVDQVYFQGAPNEVREVVGCLTLGHRTVPQYNGTQHRCGPGSRMISLARSGIHREMASERMVVMWPGAGTWHLSLSSHCSMAGQGRASLCSSQALTAVLAVTAGPCLPGCGRHGRCERQLTPGLAVLASCRSG